MSSLLAISASPRKGGNSETLLDAFLLGTGEKISIEKIRLNPLSMRPCQACDRCATGGKCAVRDDMQVIYPLVASARALVLATPIYFGSVSAQLKIFMDRFQCWWQAKYILKKPFVDPAEERPGTILCSGALHRPAYCESAAAIAKVFFHNINFKYSGQLCFQGFDERGSLARKEERLAEARRAGEKFARLI